MKHRILALLLVFLLLFTGCAAPQSEQSAAPDTHVSTDPSENTHPEDNPQPTPDQEPPNADLPSLEENTPPADGDAATEPNTPAITDGSGTLWVSPGQGEKNRPLSAVKWQFNEKENRHYLYLPAEGSLSALQVWYESSTLCKINGRQISNGDPFDFSRLGDCTVTFGSKEYPITVMKSANIGAMYITTKSGKMNYIHKKKGNKETGTMRFVDATGKELYVGALKEIKGRGNATWDKPKKPYQIKLGEKTELIPGAGTSSTWILLANYVEKTMLHNTVAFNLAYDAGLTETVRSSYLDLYCNGEYMGTYQLSEKVQIGENRLELQDLEKATEKVNEKNLDEYPAFGTEKAEKSSSKGRDIPNDPADITGGYLLEIERNDRYPGEPSGFVTKRGTAVVIKEPEYATPAQVSYISNFFQEFEDAVYAKDGICPSTGKRFDEYFDLTSLAKKYILEEFVKNIDADNTSQFYYKPADSQSKVGFCGPVWDYDNSFDVMTSGDSIDGLYAATRKKRIYHHLINHDFFMDEVRKLWKTEYLPAIAVALGEKKPGKGDAMRSLDEYYRLLSPSAAMNYALWGNIDIPINNKHIDTGDTYQEHFVYLKTFIQDRRKELNLIWLNE